MKLANKTNSILPSMLLIAGIFLLAAVISLSIGIPVAQVMKDYNYSVIVILIVMELFTNLVVETGIMQFLAKNLAVWSKGRKKRCIIFFGVLMFLISSLLNNITAVMMILPVIFVLLKAINADTKYISVFFAAILALSNTGGAASPIGDFPAIVIMTSGITTFTGYLFKAFPLFLITSIIVIIIWCFFVKEKNQSESKRLLAIELLKSRYKYHRVNKKALIPLIITMVFMFIAWSFVPQSIMPPEIIAVLGYSIGLAISAWNGIRIKQCVDMKSVLTIASFLLLASVISASGVLSQVAVFLESNITNPKLLLLAVMLITSLISGLVSAGPATAAMMPIIINLCNTSLSGQSEWVAIAYAASICAGSSLFLWSATAGFILSGKIDSAELESNGTKYSWGIKQYFKYGLLNYTIQMIIAVVWIKLAI